MLPVFLQLVTTLLKDTKLHTVEEQFAVYQSALILEGKIALI